ncbi:hypothetical protein [Methylomonas sp. AM2-LC]|uniref:hypothetical protein n=1 Tax=Methylomonas sp. AM2-LC TaxID=3153301 RepID=UPI003265D857
MAKPINIQNWLVMKCMCQTCPFNKHENIKDQSPEIANMVRSRCLTKASQICHHPRMHGKKESHLCRGARDFQLEIFSLLGVISEPTDAAWKEAYEQLQSNTKKQEKEVCHVLATA